MRRVRGVDISRKGFLMFDFKFFDIYMCWGIFEKAIEAYLIWV